MARGKVSTIVNDEPEEMTVFLVKFRGKSETLQKGFNAISEAVSTFGGAASQQKLLRANPYQTPATDKTGAPAVDDLDDEQQLDETADASSQRDGANGVKRKPPKFLSNFNLDGDGTIWMDFARQRKPRNQYDKYLLAALWLTKHGGEALFTAAHVFTCIRSAGWGDGHLDFTQPMRTMKRDKSYFDNPESRKWSLTRPGELEAESIPKIEQ